ncbi:helix-turn-helix domain-containing protein [Pseudoalteromonas sp. L23]|nr:MULTISPECIES: helix-turn-helix transcriptional regulator [unclassified Pseudoalteromonas]MCF2828623.1 helix-turn-helix domain-containing protein [Pseudoalteromonas sp. OF5H-5]MCF2924773.1 helix-turn-helix domain-containing protein [Pseudoalteromonas sp. DL2-H1]MCF7516389.1 helix-turn-helix domain-containing protein [Pseudoalteromonas sp. L7]MCF7528436.1 helix-turn-helix domain-containing protein [Pseudoalteromonas sp. L23]MCG7556011.1 helix-turn-helix domain-containing protein [Pseudoaltero
MTEQEKGKTKMIEDLSLIGSKFSGENILYMRLSLGLSLRGFAKFLNMGVSHQTVSGWESGSSKPSFEVYEECVERYLRKRNQVTFFSLNGYFFNPITLHFVKSVVSFKR